jgi:hypothetical protein
MNFKRNLKIFIIICFMFLLCGCSVNYNLEITDDNKFIEKVSIDADSEEELHETIESTNKTLYETFLELKDSYVQAYSNAHINNYEEDTVKQDGVEYYNKSYSSNKMAYNYTFKNHNDFKYSYIANYCKPSLKIISTSSNVTLSTSSFDCINDYETLNNIVIKITTNKRVISNNADEVNKNTYIWNITKDNYKTKKINFKYSLTNVSDNSNGNNDPNNNNNPNENTDPNGNNDPNNNIDEPAFNPLTVVLILLLILLFGFVIFLVLQVKNRRNNRL